MQAGDDIHITVKVLRVDGDRVDTQTPDGQLIQTDVSNIREQNKTPITVAGGAIEHDAKAASAGKTRARGR